MSNNPSDIVLPEINEIEQMLSRMKNSKNVLKIKELLDSLRERYYRHVSYLVTQFDKVEKIQSFLVKTDEHENEFEYDESLYDEN